VIDLELLQQKWAEQDRKLDATLRLNRQLLVAASLNRVPSPLRRFAFFMGLEALICFAVAAMLGQFLYVHRSEPRFLLPALALHAWVIANLAFAIRQMVMALQIDYDKPIAAIQKHLEYLRLLRIRFLQCSLLTGQLVWWVPALIVLFKGALGVDAYQAFGGTLLAVNFLFSLAVIPLAIWMSRTFGPRMGRSPILQRLIWAIAGHNLNAASRFLATLSEFAAK
jgi:hypothetical protein